MNISMQHISAESYNNKLRVISLFLHYLQVTDCIGEFSNPIPLYYKKIYPVVNEIDNMDHKLDLLTAHLGEFPDELRIMNLILLTTGIKKEQLFLLKNADFYYENENLIAEHECRHLYVGITVTMAKMKMILP